VEFKFYLNRALKAYFLINNKSLNQI